MQLVKRIKGIKSTDRAKRRHLNYIATWTKQVEQYLQCNSSYIKSFVWRVCMCTQINLEVCVVACAENIVKWHHNHSSCLGIRKQASGERELLFYTYTHICTCTHTLTHTHSHLQEQESSSGALMISTTLKHDKVTEGIGHWSTRKSRRKASEDQELTGEPILSRGEPSVWMTGMSHHCGRQRVFSTSQSQGTAFQVVVLPVLRFHTPSVTFWPDVASWFSQHSLSINCMSFWLLFW